MTVIPRGVSVGACSRVWRRRRLWALASVIGMIAPALVHAQAVGRQVVPLATGWQFRFGDVTAAAASTATDGWTSVALPHTWNRLGGDRERAATDDLRRGKGWYRLILRRATPLGGRRAFLQFDGASIVTDVWLNGVHLGRHGGAFGRFRLDATAALKAGQNVLVVSTDNSEPKEGSATREVIPVTGDWFMFGGLYRSVSLVTTGPVHLDLLDHGSSGMSVRAATIGASSATVLARALLRNDGVASLFVRVTMDVRDAAGKVVASSTVARTVPRGGMTAEMRMVVPRPHLWNGVADPYLYTARVTIRDAAGRTLDTTDQPLGLRTIRLDPERGFMLNGRVTPLHGVALHQDRKGTGWAISPEQRAQDFRLIREMGANTVRLSHYQHDQQAYDLADRLGLVLWTELPLVGRPSPEGEAETTPGMKANAEEQMRELIRQNVNHPSVAVWGIGNEVNFDSATRQQPTEPLPLLRTLQALARVEDASRPTVLADCCGTFPGEGIAGLPARKARLDSLVDVADALGVNRYFGWYSRSADFLSADLDRLRARVSDRAVAISEYGAGAGLTQHSDDPRGGPVAAFSRPHPEEYQAWLHQQWWPQIERRGDLWASWIWNMFDFASPARQEGDLVDTNDKGLVTYDRVTRKDAFFYYKAQWNPAPMAHLTGSRYTVRAYPVARIIAYSNADRLTLAVNGVTFKEASCPGHVCTWNAVPLVDGENRLTVSGIAAGQPVSDTMAVRRVRNGALYAIPAGVLTAGGDASAPVGSDAFFQGGTGHDTRIPDGPARGPFGPMAVTGGGRPELLRGWRSGTFRYVLPVPAGRHRVRLSFFEPDPATAPGTRMFGVLANGRQIVTRLDVRAEAGAAGRTVERTFDVEAAAGLIDLSFVPERGQAIVSAIEVDPVR